MKKAFYLLLVFGLSLGLVSCSSDDDNTPTGNDNKYFKAIEGSWIETREIPIVGVDLQEQKFYNENNENLVDYLGANKKADGTTEIVTYTKLCTVTKDSIIMSPYGGSLYPTRTVSRYAYKLENNTLTLTQRVKESITGQISTRFVRQ